MWEIIEGDFVHISEDGRETVVAIENDDYYTFQVRLTQKQLREMVDTLLPKPKVTRGRPRKEASE